MKLLKEILGEVDVISIIGSVDVPVKDLVFDSRELSEGDVFFAIEGTQNDGAKFIDDAIKKKVSVIVCEVTPFQLSGLVTYVIVESSKKTLAKIASNFYGNPSHKLKLVGVTGTNGKTTISNLLYRLFLKLDKGSGLLSTIKIMVGDKEFETKHTTPDSVNINRYLAMMVEEGCEYCFMEVSSHGIDQYRTHGLNFVGGVFTNLSHDHLDYHKTFIDYRDVKKKFFDDLPKTAFALVNYDDKNGSVMLQNTSAQKMGYALKTRSDFSVKILEKGFTGTLLSVDGTELWVRLIGQFNAYNILAVYGVALILGASKIEVLKVLSDLDSVEGRFQYVSSDKGVVGIVDYAHTPDALQNVLVTINGIKKPSQKLITVVGCGGDRDKFKRPIMASVAFKLSDQLIITSDNPRTEDPLEIVSQMEEGVEVESQQNILTIIDRRQAVRAACKLAKSGDIVLVAGKGHENYQEIKGKRYHFDDCEELQKGFNN